MVTRVVFIEYAKHSNFIFKTSLFKLDDSGDCNLCYGAGGRTVLSSSTIMPFPMRQNEISHKILQPLPDFFFVLLKVFLFIVYFYYEQDFTF